MGADINLERWYNKNRSLYQSLLTKAESIVKELLDGENVSYFKIDNRLKEFPNWKDKFLQEKYDSPEKVLDLAGLRIVGLTLGNVRRIENVLVKNFKIHSPGKDDKQKELGRDKIGYISIHYTVSLSDDHIKLWGREFIRCLATRIT